MDKSQETREEADEIQVNALGDEQHSGMGDMVKKFGTVIIVLSLLIVAFSGYYFWNKQKTAEESQKATIAIKGIMPFMESEEYDKALNGAVSETGEKLMGLVKIADEYSGLAQGDLAAMYAGNAFLLKGDYTKAAEYFEKAKDAESKEVKMGSLAGIGASLEYQGKMEEAAKSYEAASALTEQEIIKSRYLLFAGLNYENAKNKEKAVGIYQEVLNINRFSEFAGMAKSGLIRLGTKID